MSIVSKFGGSSVKDSEAMLRCARIVAANAERKIIVISAIQNTTNQLEEMVSLSKSNLKTELEKLLLEIETRHKIIAQELNLKQKDNLQKLFTELRSLSNEVVIAKACSSSMMDGIYAMGERISSLLFTAALNKSGIECELLDARDFIITDSAFNRARPQISLIAKKVQTLLPLKNVYVTQGFIGKNSAGQTTTLGREGSDFSAALFGEAIGASAIEIWTDVPGVATIDPRIDDRAKYLIDLSYDEATTMAQLGSKVLFSQTLMPAQRKNIPVFVGSSMKPDGRGTWIRAQSTDQSSDVKGIAVYPHHVQIDFVIFEDSLKVETLKSIADWIEKFNLDLTQLTWKNNIISLWIYARKGLSQEATKALSNYTNLGKVKISEDLALVSTIGKKTETIIVPTEKAHELARILHHDLLSK